MTSATITFPSVGPITAGQQQELSLARDRARPIRRAARVATFNTWITGIFAALSAPFALFSITALLVTIGLAVIAYNEFHGRRRLLDCDSSAASLLGWNQLGFLALIIVYCVWMLYSGLTGESPFAAALAANPELQAAGVEFSELGDDLYRICLIAVYGTVIVLSAIFQGLNAVYYFTRRKCIDKYVATTPAWVRDLLRTTISA